MTKRRVSKEKRRYWTPDEIALVRRRYPDELTSVLAADINRKTAAVYALANKLGIAKSQAFHDSPLASRLRRGGNIGAATRFKPGNTPWQKGTKGIFKPGGRAPSTQFKKGVKPPNYLPVGSYRLSKEGYVQRKVTDTGYPPDDWRAVHQLLWEEHNGPVPPAHAIAFRDGDMRNITIENLELVSRAELMRRNTLHNYPKELARVIQLRGAVNRQIKRRIRRAEQDRGSEESSVRDARGVAG